VVALAATQAMAAMVVCLVCRNQSSHTGLLDKTNVRLPQVPASLTHNRGFHKVATLKFPIGDFIDLLCRMSSQQNYFSTRRVSK
jgi:hypothetical protein